MNLDAVAFGVPLRDLLLFFGIGLAAQCVDGALGMAYKVTSSSLLLSLGVPPAAVSASVHTASIVTSGVSGYAHWRLGNIDYRLLRRLLLPGIIGGVLGGMVLSNLPAESIRPWVAGYLMLLGLFILYRALKGAHNGHGDVKGVEPVAFFGGLLDAVGGGGWGPIVTTTLVGHGVPPRAAIASVNAAEFFVSAAIAAVIIVASSPLWPAVAALVAGGTIAAPFAAMATKLLPQPVLMIAVGVVIIVLSLRTLIAAIA